MYMSSLCRVVCICVVYLCDLLVSYAELATVSNRWAFSPRNETFEAVKNKFLAQPLADCPIDSHDSKTLSVDDFVQQYEVPMKAVIIRNIPKNDQWPAHEKWHFDKFKSVKKRYFKVGEDDDGYSLKVSKKMNYIHILLYKCYA